jgi:hypothetical protein
MVPFTNPQEVPVATALTEGTEYAEMVTIAAPKQPMASFMSTV